jgi:hypothetical protein
LKKIKVVKKNKNKKIKLVDKYCSNSTTAASDLPLIAAQDTLW